MASQAASTVDPARHALADVEHARSLLVAAVRLAPIKRGTVSATTTGPNEGLEDRVGALCDRVAGLITLQFPAARRPAAKLVLP
jgi:hypothetical protein